MWIHAAVANGLRHLAMYCCDDTSIDKAIWQGRESKRQDAYPSHLANVIQLLIYQFCRTKREVVLVAPYNGRPLGGLPRNARVDIVQCTSALAAFDDMELGGTHELTVDRLDSLSRQ